MSQAQQQARLLAARRSLSLTLLYPNRTCRSLCQLGCLSTLVFCLLRCCPFLLCFVQLLFRRPLRAEAVNVSCHQLRRGMPPCGACSWNSGNTIVCKLQT
jgi:hypothetical protein